MFRKYGLNECIQKIAFLAMTSVETGFFQTAGEISGNTASSQYFYKGRGLLQLTGNGNQPVMYSDYQQKIGTAHDIIGSPDLVAQKLFLAVDSGGWVWNQIKAPSWPARGKKSYETQTEFEAKMRAFEWKRNKFPKGLSKNLNEIALLMKENEEDYFFLISRLLQGYLPTSTDDYPTTLHLDRRKQNLQKIKTWFKYDKNVCDSGGIIPELSGRAPWMDVALKLAKEMKGCVESNEPMYSKAKSYLVYCNNSYEPTDGINGPWCAAYMNWCISQTTNPITNVAYKHSNSASSQAPLNNPKYKKIDEPIYGCIVVYRANNGKGHTGFLYGKTKKGGYILLGGNQDDTIKFSSYGEYTSRSLTKKLYGFYVPADYQITEKDKLSESDIYDDGDNDIYNDGDIINILYGIKAGNNTGQTN